MRFSASIGSLLTVFLLLNSNSIRAADPDPKPVLTILYTAESHAALLPCDCPLQPLGGVARRATLIKQYRKRGPVLLLDGGGWAAGGMYDEDSDGDSTRDKLRTELMRKTMKLMKYDAIVLGPDEAKALANPDDAPGPLVPQPYKMQDNVSTIFGWSEPGTLIFGKQAPAPADIRVESHSQPQPRIHISRLGESRSEALEGAELVFNAGRKSSQRVSWRAADKTVINFDYQARNLVIVEVFADGAAKFNVRLEPLGKEIPDDPEVAALLAPHLEALKKKGKQTIELEYWMMPDCPACKLARPEIQKIARDLAGRVTIAPHWVVEKKGDKLTSLHGDEELNEARVQALVLKYYPDKIWDWLEWRADNRDPWKTGAAKLGLLTPRIENALEAGDADELLRADYDLSERRRISATPFVVISNRLYADDIDRLHLLGALCGALAEPKPAACKDAPACFFDAQCRKRGFVAKCIDAGTPPARCDTSKAAVKVPATVLVDNAALTSNRDTILEALLGFLPGLDYVLLDVASPEGKRLAEQAKITRLPAYLLDPIARTEEGYKAGIGRAVRDIAIKNENGAEKKLLLLREDGAGVGSNQLFFRQRIKGRADLFVSRFSKNGQEALETALEYAASKGGTGLTLALHDVLYLNEEGKLAAKNGIAEVEEAARTMAVRLSAADKLNAYLIERGKKRGSSYWDTPLKATGLDPDKIRALADSPLVLQKLEDERALLKSLDSGGEIVLLAENCELIKVSSRSDLRQVLERIASRK